MCFTVFSRPHLLPGTVSSLTLSPVSPACTQTCVCFDLPVQGSHRGLLCLPCKMPGWCAIYCLHQLGAESLSGWDVGLPNCLPLRSLVTPALHPMAFSAFFSRWSQPKVSSFASVLELRWGHKSRLWLKSHRLPLSLLRISRFSWINTSDFALWLRSTSDSWNCWSFL